MNKRIKAFFPAARIVCACLMIFSFILLSGCEKKLLDPANPVKIIIWHYYNGSQLSAFDEMVNEFNNTKGKDVGVYVEAKTMGSVDSLSEKVRTSANGNTGAEKMPNIFGSYSDIAFIVDRLGLAADISQYMTQAEMEEYVQSFIDEGRLPGNKEQLKIFPIAKSSEIIMVDKTLWEEFKAASGIADDALKTWESLVQTAEKYYNWTLESKGKAQSFFGIDYLANFVFCGAKQLGIDVTSNKNGEGEYNLEETILRRIWDVYYPGYVKGYFGGTAKYRSEDLKKGALAAYLGSTTACAYFPLEISGDDGLIRPAEPFISPVPVFEGGQKIAIQQGAGMVVVKSSPKEEAASVEFLKWFTEAENNIGFALLSSYFPVKTDALFGGALKAKLDEMKSGTQAQKNTADTFETAVSMFGDYTLYWADPHNDSYDFRDAVENGLLNAASAGRELYLKYSAEGMSPEEAFAAVDSDAEFHKWLDTLKAFRQ